MSDEISANKSENNNLLVEPKRKKNFGFPKCYPFPTVGDSGEQSNCVIIGHLKEHCVEVTGEKDMELIFTHGFFGKGTLSRSTPQCVEKKVQERLNESKKQFKQSQCVDDSSDKSDATHEKEDEVELMDINESSSNNDDTEFLTESDSRALSDIEPTTSKNDEKEALQLSLEEAFFLSYGLGVLVVKDKNEPLDLMRLWQTFCEIHPNKNFPAMYIAYHHFRSKGWIVRCGIKYGCDFVLYKDGPPFYHSSYAVIVKPVKEKNFRDISHGGRPNLTWASLAAAHRICSHSSKAVLILYVIKPASVVESKISTPFCLSQFQVEEVQVNRWVPSEEQRLDS